MALAGCTEAPNLNPPISLSAFLDDSIVEPNLKPPVSFGASAGTLSSFLFVVTVPNENPFVSVVFSVVAATDDSGPNLRFACLSAPGCTPNLKVETADGVETGFTPGRGSSHDLQRLS